MVAIAKPPRRMKAWAMETCRTQAVIWTTKFHSRAALANDPRSTCGSSTLHPNVEDSGEPRDGQSEWEPRERRRLLTSPSDTAVYLLLPPGCWVAGGVWHEQSS